MNTRLQKFTKACCEKYGGAWTAFRIVAGLALVCHAAWLFSAPWAVGNWLDLRTSELLRIVVPSAVILAGLAIAAGAFARLAAIIAAPLYYWAALHDLVSNGIEPIHHTAANALAFLVLMALGIFGPGRHTLSAWWGERKKSAQPAPANATPSAKA